MPPGASRFCRVDGSSREPLPGSTDVAGSPRTSRLPSQAPLLGSSSPISAASPGGSQWLESNQLFMSQTLRDRHLFRSPIKSNGTPHHRAVSDSRSEDLIQPTGRNAL